MEPLKAMAATVSDKGKHLAQRSCTFCGASKPLTREHVIPVWLQRYVGGEEKGGFRGTHVSWTGTPLSKRKAGANSHTLGTVCAPCNNGWMSRLESDFGRLLPRLQADMSPGRFSKAERRTIARWIVKTGITAHRSANYRPILPAWLPIALSQGANIPAGIKVFSGNVGSKKTIKWVQSNIGLCVVHPTDVPTFDAYNDTFVFALSIVNIFIGFAWHGLNPKEFEVFYPAGTLHRIYPHPEAATSRCVLEDVAFATTEVALRRKPA